MDDAQTDARTVTLSDGTKWEYRPDREEMRRWIKLSPLPKTGEWLMFVPSPFLSKTGLLTAADHRAVADVLDPPAALASPRATGSQKPRRWLIVDKKSGIECEVIAYHPADNEFFDYIPLYDHPSPSLASAPANYVQVGHFCTGCGIDRGNTLAPHAQCEGDRYCAFCGLPKHEGQPCPRDLAAVQSFASSAPYQPSLAPRGGTPFGFVIVERDGSLSDTELWLNSGFAEQECEQLDLIPARRRYAPHKVLPLYTAPPSLPARAVRSGESMKVHQRIVPPSSPSLASFDPSPLGDEDTLRRIMESPEARSNEWVVHAILDAGFGTHDELRAKVRSLSGKNDYLHAANEALRHNSLASATVSVVVDGMEYPIENPEIVHRIVGGGVWVIAHKDPSLEMLQEGEDGRPDRLIHSGEYIELRVGRPLRFYTMAKTGGKHA